MKAGDRVMVPRTGGSKSPGEIVEVYGDKVRVKFVVGETFQGKPTPDEDKERYGYKTVSIDQLVLITEPNESREAAMMKTITLWEPWASLVALNQKKNETRSWYTDYRGALAIHSAKKISRAIAIMARQEPFFTALSPRHDIYRNEDDGEIEAIGLEFAQGCILGVGNLVDCLYIGADGLYAYNSKTKTPEKKVRELPEGNELKFGDYTEGRFAWLMSNTRELIAPIPAKGYQRIWNWDETPHLVSIDPWIIGDTKIWTPKGVRSGRRLDKPDEDAVQGLEVA